MQPNLLRNKLLTAAKLVLTCISMFQSGTANATMTEVMGGPGGRSYSLNCPGASFLIDVFAKTGSWIDSVGLLWCSCRRRVGQGVDDRSRAEHRWSGRLRTGNLLPPGEAMTGIGLAYTRGGGLDRQYVNTIDIFCPSTEHFFW